MKFNVGIGIIHKYFTLRFDPYAFLKVEASKIRNFYLRDMKKRKFSKTQIAGILKQYDPVVIAAGLCRESGARYQYCNMVQLEGQGIALKLV